MDWIAIASGFAVGCIVGLTGVGGGSLMTPLLIGAFRMPAPVAIGTDLWFAALTKSGGTLAHHRLGTVDRRITAWMLAGSVPAAVIVIAWMHAGSAGAIGATLIVLLYPRLPAARVVGTDIAYAMPLTLVSGIGHASLGHVDWLLLGSLLIGSLPGIWLGARLASSLPDQLVRTALCVSLVTAGVKVIG